jgi:hypothetical protein
VHRHSPDATMVADHEHMKAVLEANNFLTVDLQEKKDSKVELDKDGKPVKQEESKESAKKEVPKG